MNLSSRNKGILLLILSSLCFAFMNAFVAEAGDIPVVQKSFFRNAVSVITALIVLKKNNISFTIPKIAIKPLLLRSIFGTVGILCNFYAVSNMPLSDASLLNKMAPFFVIIFSFILLKEKISFWQFVMVIGAFVGALFVIKPSFHGVPPLPASTGFCGGMFAGAAYTMVRKMRDSGLKGPTIVFFFSLFSCIVSLLLTIPVFTIMSMHQFISLLLAGLSAAFAQFAITSAYFHAPAREISVYDYSQILFAAILGFILFNQIPDAVSLIGYAIIISMAIFMYFYNNRKTT